MVKSNGHRVLTIEQIMAAQDLRESTVAVPQWDGMVRIRELTKRQYDEVIKQASTIEDRAVRALRVRLLVMQAALVEPALTVEQLEALQDKNFLAWRRVSDAIDNLSDLSPEDFERVEGTFREKLAR